MNFVLRRTYSKFLINRNAKSIFVEVRMPFDPYQRQCLPSFRSVLSIRLSTTNTQMTSARASQQSDLLRLTKKKTNFQGLILLIFLILFIRLPVPTLAETSIKFLKTVAPLLNNDEFNETKKVRLFEYKMNNIIIFYVDC
jgi:hypothetical protein